jgi:hypothetical protein
VRLSTDNKHLTDVYQVIYNIILLVITKMKDEFEQQQDIVVSAQQVNSALVQGLKSATKNLVTNDLYLPRKEYKSPEVRQIFDYGIIEKEAETSTQRNWRNFSVISSAFGTWYLTSGIIKVSVLTTASLGAGFVLPGIGIVYCGVKSVSHFLNKEYNDSMGCSLVGGIIITSTASTIIPLWQSQGRTERDLGKYKLERDQYQQYSEGYKPTFNLDGFAPLLIIWVIAIGIKILTTRSEK